MVLAREDGEPKMHHAYPLKREERNLPSRQLTLILFASPGEDLFLRLSMLHMSIAVSISCGDG